MITPWAGIALGVCLGLNPVETVADDDSMAKIQQEYGQAYNEARGKLSADAVAEFCDRCFAIASDDFDQQVPALMMVLSFVSRSDDQNLDGPWSEAIELIIESYLDEPEIASLVMTLGSEAGRRAADAKSYLAEIEEETGNPQIKACVGFARLQPLQNQKASADYGGPPLSKEQDAELLAGLEKAAANLGDLQDQYGRVLKDLVAGTLFEMKNLQIGCPVPDIVGKDLDGVSFKLSDYRGKVVVIDFWGHW